MDAVIASLPKYRLSTTVLPDSSRSGRQPGFTRLTKSVAGVIRSPNGAFPGGHGPAAPSRPLRRPRPDRDPHRQGRGQAAAPVPELFVLSARRPVPAAPCRRAAHGAGGVHRDWAAVVGAAPGG